MRKQKLKSLAKTYFIFWEWDTEEYYFDILKRFPEYKNFNYIENIGWFRSKDNLEKTFTDIVKNINKKTKYSKAQIKKTNSKVIFVIDADIFSKNDIDRIKVLEKEYDFLRILFNNKNIEDFLLLHLKYFDIEKDCIKELESFVWKKYEKWRKWDPFYKECIKKWFENNLLKSNLEKLEKFHWNKHLKEKIPFSELWEILFPKKN